MPEIVPVEWFPQSKTTLSYQQIIWYLEQYVWQYHTALVAQLLPAGHKKKYPHFLLQNL